MIGQVNIVFTMSASGAANLSMELGGKNYIRQSFMLSERQREFIQQEDYENLISLMDKVHSIIKEDFADAL